MVEIPNNLKGNITVQYKKTMVQKVSLIISGIGFIVIIIYASIKLLKRHFT